MAPSFGHQFAFFFFFCFTCKQSSFVQGSVQRIVAKCHLCKEKDSLQYCFNYSHCTMLLPVRVAFQHPCTQYLDQDFLAPILSPYFHYQYQSQGNHIPHCTSSLARFHSWGDKDLLPTKKQLSEKCMLRTVYKSCQMIILLFFLNTR